MKYDLFSRQTLITATCWTLAPLFFVLAVIGAVRFHTAVPFWDMWDGYLHFYVRVTEGDWKAWWSLHNEHRIVLARILFWIDLAWFQGTVWFLIAVNYLLILVAFFTFHALLREQAGDEARSRPVTLLALATFMLLFSWVQYENLTWGFQGQFFLAQLLPLLAFYFLYRYVKNDTTHNFGLACIFGVLSIGSMANGVIALPLMVAYAIVERAGWKKVGILSILSAICLFVYFFDYKSPPHHGSIGKSIMEHPGQMFQYFFAYLGSPFYYYLPGNHALITAQIFGILLILLSSLRAFQSLRQPKKYALELSLLTFILYIGGTALATAGGRSIFGVEQATTSRYTTPALMAWVALIVVYSPFILKSLKQWQHRIVWSMMVFLLVITPFQVKARKSHHMTLYVQELGALAMTMGVNDHAQIQTTFYDPNSSAAIVKKPSEANLSIFGRAPFKGVAQLIGQKSNHLPTSLCTGLIDQILPIDQERKYKKVKGWLLSVDDKNDFQSVQLIDNQGIVVGYALMGDSRPELRKTHGKEARFRGFSGYVLAQKAHQPLTIIAPEASCSVLAALPQTPPFRNLDGNAQIDRINVSASAVENNAGWTGKDYYKSEWPGIRVLGSYIVGDSDIGTVTLRLKPGATFMYRTGPDNRRQLITVNGGVDYEGKLPASLDWKTLVFDDPTLTQDFTVTISDEGADWGEWSAIAVKDNEQDVKK